ANTNPGPDTIAFRIGDGGLQSIRPTTALPVITDPVEIDGTTQPGYEGQPLIELNGTNAGAEQVNGLTITAGNRVVRGLVVNGFSGRGIVLRGNGSNHIAGNYLGTNAAGTSSVLNFYAGLLVEADSPNNLIGGTKPEDRNLLSGNLFYGALVLSSGNRIQG